MGWVGFLQRVQTQTDQKSPFITLVVFAEASAIVIQFESLLLTKNKSLFLIKMIY